MNKYTPPKCKCGEYLKLLEQGNWMYSYKIYKNGNAEKFSPNKIDLDGGTNFDDRLECSDLECGTTYDFDNDKKGRIIRGDELIGK